MFELDYLHEAENQIRFKTELEPKLGGRVYVPDVHVGLTTQKVLVTEWIEGKQLAKSPKEVINRLTPVGVECFLVQVQYVCVKFLFTLSKQCSHNFFSSWKLATSTPTPTPATCW